MSKRCSSGKHRHHHGAFRLRSLPRTFRPQTHKKRFGSVLPGSRKIWVLWENQELELQWNFLTPKTLVPGRKTIQVSRFASEFDEVLTRTKKISQFRFCWVGPGERERERCKNSGRKEQPPHKKKVLKSFLLLCRNPKTMNDEFPGTQLTFDRRDLHQFRELHNPIEHPLAISSAPSRHPNVFLLSKLLSRTRERERVRFSEAGIHGDVGGAVGLVSSYYAFLFGGGYAFFKHRSKQRMQN